ncbi:putative cytochrome P450 [Rosellinia necatrix]|uniref:Putative cytochrome P450 n=1 Tax=Rosellinia necatrix TaxID=77044 RepID=A0A1W2TF26_ROSNE|nr:putative cytochrome P450 [Rosellinia necatrix]
MTVLQRVMSRSIQIFTQDMTGPVVRVTPTRVHISDPKYFHEIYGITGANKYLKDPGFFSTGGGIKHSVIMLTDPEAHRIRRKTIQNLFSPKGMQELSPRVEEVVKGGLEKLRISYKEGKPIDMNRIFKGVTADTIMQLMFGKTLGLIDSPEEEPEFVKIMRMFAQNFSWQKHFPIVNTISVLIPQSWADYLVPGYARFRKQCGKWLDEVTDRHKQGIYTDDYGRATIFDFLLRPNAEKGQLELSRDVLIDEAFAFFFAGTDTTSYALSMGSYYLMSNPSKLEKLRKELSDVPTNADGLLQYNDIRNLPYFSATIKEILRLACPVPGITPRVVPEEGMDVAGQYLPKGTIISLSMRMVHFNDSTYSDPYEFIPERWLGSTGKELDKWFVTFSKGPRMCLGLNMAYLEIYLCLANFFNQFNFELHKTDENTAMWVDMGAAAKSKETIKAIVVGPR